MPKHQDIKVLNIDGVPYAVDGMSDQVKGLVEIYNEWAQREGDLKSDILMVQSAMNNLSQQIVESVRREKEKAEEAEEGDDSADPEMTE